MSGAFGTFDRAGEVREPAAPRLPFGYNPGAEAHWQDRADVQRHEDGHARLLNRYGVGVAWFGKRVYRDRGGWAGYTRPASWERFERLSPEQQIAIYDAGHAAQRNRHARSESDEMAIAAIANGDAALEARGRARARRDL